MTKMTKIMTITITAISLAAVGVFMNTNSDDGFSALSWNFEKELQYAGLIETPNGAFSVPGYLKSIEANALADTFFLSDEPGNWFKSGTLGVPLSIITPGQAVDFDLSSETDTKHTVTSLVGPVDEDGNLLLLIDQKKADDDTIGVQFNDPGIYLFGCKVHPYMGGIVVVKNDDGSLPDVKASELPFIERAAPGADAALPATLVASILTNIAPIDSGDAGTGIILGKAEKWDILSEGEDFHGVEVGVPEEGTFTPGVGKVWINTQFEKVAGQTTSSGEKPGSNTILDAATFQVVDEMNGISNFDGDEQSDQGKWNNPHNMWTNVNHSVIYNGNWFGNWLNLIDMESGDIKDSITVGKAPTHIVTIPNENSDQFGILTLPLSAEDEILMIEDRNGKRLSIEDHFQTGSGNNHPHGQWITADGTKILIPNVFQGLGLVGTITVMDAETGDILSETSEDSSGEPLLLPIAAGIKGSDVGYVSNAAAGTVSVIDMNTGSVTKDIRVACFNPDLSVIGLGTPGGDGTGTCSGATSDSGIILETLKVPIQTPVSPDGKFVATAVLSLAISGVNQDTIAIINTSTNEVDAELPCPAGCHGVNWGAKNLNGIEEPTSGYYAYVTSQHANVLTVVDPDPNGDGDASDAKIIAVIPLNGDTSAGVTDGTGGQGILPLPLVKDGWIQDTVAACDDGDCTSEVDGWVNQLTPSQKDPSK